MPAVVAGAYGIDDLDDDALHAAMDLAERKVSAAPIASGVCLR
jgi:hypothetical protein